MPQDISSVATGNAELFRAALERQAEAERRREVAEGMREILKSLNLDQTLPQILNNIVVRASQLLGADAGVIRRMEADGSLVVRVVNYNMPPELVDQRVLPVLPTSGNLAIAGREPAIIPDFAAYTAREATTLEPVMKEMYEARGREIAAHFSSLLRVPLVARDQLYGELALFYRAPRQFTDDDVGLALTIADQTALAIENSLLRQQAADVAAITERARLARELHDSVTQSIYSVTLYAEAAARLVSSGEHAQAAEYLRDLRDTSQEALREMRMLVFELRPPALEQVGLAGALQARLKAVEARGGMATELRVTGPGPAAWLSLRDQQEIYTIAQEALNNALKHAHARRVNILLEFAEQCASLRVRDDGAGFDPVAARASGGMGIAGMAERAERIDAVLRIESCPGVGTTVTVEVPRDRNRIAGSVNRT